MPTLLLNATAPEAFIPKLPIFMTRRCLVTMMTLKLVVACQLCPVELPDMVPFQGTLLRLRLEGVITIETAQ